MKSLSKSRLKRVPIIKQRGVVLFFTLIALLAMSLAAVALIRSVDTGTLIAGNLAFKQSATSSGDAGIEAAIALLTNADVNAAGNGLDVLTDPAHPFNSDNAAAGYYSSANPALSLTDGTGIQWDATDSCGLGVNCINITDNSGNTVRYVIQRMCRDANMTLGNPNADCLFSGVVDSGDEAGVKTMQEQCDPGPCTSMSPPPQIRITARATGPKNSVSYVQAFVY